MKKPQISVIMSVYNGMPYLKKAVGSILRQTFKNFEFIIVDDASTDNTWKYLKSLKDKRIKLIKNNKNKGLAISLNKALRVCRGEFVARMDADDISRPERLKKQLKFLISHPMIDLCGTWVDLSDENGTVIGEKKFPQKDKQIKNAIDRFNPLIHPTYMAKKSFFDKLGGYRKEYDGAEDYDLLVRAKKEYKFANLNEKLLLWRLRSDRRSIDSMRKMDKLELKIKLESLTKNGISLSLFIWTIKKILLIYLFPYFIKIKLAKLLKLA